MKRLFLLSLPFFSIFPVFGNDISWKNTLVSQDLSIQMPETVYTMDTLQMKLVSSQMNGYLFQVKYIKAKFVVNSGDQLEQGYDDFLKGWTNSKDVNLLTHTITDTSFGGTTGRWIRSVYSKNNSYLEILSYLVLANSHFYLVTISGNRPIKEDMRQAISNYFQSIKFSSPNIKEFSGDFPLQAKSYRFGQKLGFFTRILIIASIIGVIAHFFYKAIIRKKKQPGP